ncbi:uncharacterized protein LOC107195731 [Pteropus alecto]|uniref:uncharacterized protein LOC107195731 n=1 Tax=Pteropus alecto TaxID=9402 RepID=UPI0007687065|nr:uncharacterized protein LOC107195731 [Pteropus alecto]XP_024903063.1 uncharacterized protein LOC107195731 [Pteropus alecto]XP_024903064.1 uncharacterized protein LOC107195731 [Pteropus alecto]XP_024903065.1 uncharacterized protein LOC107195731 [Pteropus alecto]
MQAGPPRVPIVRPELQGKRRGSPEKTTLGSHQRVGTRGGSCSRSRAGTAAPSFLLRGAGPTRAQLPAPSFHFLYRPRPVVAIKGMGSVLHPERCKGVPSPAATAGWIIGSGQNGRPQPNCPLRPSSKGTSPLPGRGPDAVRCSGKDSFLPQAGLVPDAPLSGRGPVVRPPTEAHPCLADPGPRCGHGQLPTPMLGLLESDCPHELPVPLDPPSRLRIRASRGLGLGAACTVVTPPAVWSSREPADRAHRQPPILGSSAAIVRLFGLLCPQAFFPEGPSGTERSVCFFPAFMSTDTISVRWSSPACPAPSSLFRPLPETSFPGRLPPESRECTGVCSFDSPDAAQAPTTGPGTQ